MRPYRMKPRRATAQSDLAATGLAQRAFTGYLFSLQDFFLIVEGARRGLIPRLTSKPSELEKMTLVRNGAVLVWLQSEADMQRWKDGKDWSETRGTHPYLIYREVSEEDPKLKHGSDRPIPVSPEARPLCGQLEWRRKATHKKKDCWVVDNGLVKRAISVDFGNGMIWHAFSYFYVEDILSGRLKRPSEDPALRKLKSELSEWMLVPNLYARAKKTILNVAVNESGRLVYVSEWPMGQRRPIQDDEKLNGAAPSDTEDDDTSRFAGPIQFPAPSWPNSSEPSEVEPALSLSVRFSASQASPIMGPYTPPALSALPNAPLHYSPPTSTTPLFHPYPRPSRPRQRFQADRLSAYPSNAANFGIGASLVSEVEGLVAGTSSSGPTQPSSPSQVDQTQSWRWAELSPSLTNSNGEEQWNTANAFSSFSDLDLWPTEFASSSYLSPAQPSGHQRQKSGSTLYSPAQSSVTYSSSGASDSVASSPAFTGTSPYQPQRPLEVQPAWNGASVPSMPNWGSTGVSTSAAQIGQVPYKPLELSISTHNFQHNGFEPQTMPYVAESGSGTWLAHQDPVYVNSSTWYNDSAIQAPIEGKEASAVGSDSVLQWTHIAPIDAWGLGQAGSQ